MTKVNLVLTIIILIILIIWVYPNNESFSSISSQSISSQSPFASGTIVSWIHRTNVPLQPWDDNSRLDGYFDETTNIPEGWVVCDGRAYTKTDGTTTGYTPNLVGKFILGGSGSGSDNDNVIDTPSEGPEWNTGNKSDFGNLDMYANINSIPDPLSVGGNSHISLTKEQMPKHYHLLVTKNPSNTGAISDTNYLSGFVPEQNMTTSPVFTF